MGNNSIAKFILGKKDFMLENKIFNTTTFSIAVLTIILAFIIPFPAENWQVFIPFYLSSIVYTLFFYHSRFKGRFRGANRIFIIFSFFFFSYLWLMIAAYSDSVDLLFPLLLVLGLTTIQAKRHIAYLIAIILNMALLDLLVYHFPQLVYNFPQGANSLKLMEDHISVLFFILILAFIISYFKYNYDRERYVVQEQNRKLINNNEALKNRNAHLESLARMVSHNLRSPMAGMKMLYELYDKLETPEEKDEINDNIKTGAFQLFTMIEDLAAIMLDYKELIKETESLELKEVAEKIHNQLRPLIRKEDADITYDFSGYPEVMYYEVYLESIFHNLLTNSLKYRSPHRRPVIKVKSYVENGRVMLSFCDNGLGIDLSKHREQLFKMYKTFHKDAGQDSKGIGLFITKNQVEMNGGKLTVSSEPDKGSCFYIELYRL